MNFDSRSKVPLNPTIKFPQIVQLRERLRLHLQEPIFPRGFATFSEINTPPPTKGSFSPTFM